MAHGDHETELDSAHRAAAPHEPGEALLLPVLFSFFILGTAATKLGYARKARLGLAQESGGRRGFSHAFSNVGVAAICAIAVSRLSRVEESPLEWMAVAYSMGIAALATAAADTTASMSTSSPSRVPPWGSAWPRPVRYRHPTAPRCWPSCPTRSASARRWRC